MSKILLPGIHDAPRRALMLVAAALLTFTVQLAAADAAAAEVDLDASASAVTSRTESGSAVPGRSSVPAPAFSPPPRLQRRTDFSSQNMAVEFRFGPYAPQVRPVAPDFFGDKTRYLIGFEVDGQLWRAPHVGTLGIGLGWGYTRESAINRISDSYDPEVAEAEQALVAEKSTLHIMPMYTVGVLRVDVLARDFGVPLVGYGKFGLGYALWWLNDGSGIATDAQGQKGKDSSIGTQAALGAMLLLDVLEPSAGAELDASAGINNSYIFLEWSVSNFGGNDQTNVGANTWVTGLAIEL